MPEQSVQTPIQETAASSDSAPRGRAGLVLVGGLLLAGILALVAYALYGSAGSSALGPTLEQEPKTVGIIYFRQQIGNMEGFKRGMENLGYTNVTYIEELVQTGPTVADDIREATLRLIAANVDVLWMAMEQQAKVAIDVTREVGRTEIPIVFLNSYHDAVEYGLVASQVSSANNATGVSVDITEVVQRTAVFLREISPDAQTIGIFGRGFMIPGIAQRYFEEWERQAPRFGFEIVEYTTDTPSEGAEAAWHAVAATIQQGDIDALVHVPGHFYDVQEVAEYDMARRFGIPHTVPPPDLPGGGHFAYSADIQVSAEQTAIMVDKIFKGAHPSSIPLEFSAQNNLTLHMQRATETGLIFPETMLSIAEEFVE